MMMMMIDDDDDDNFINIDDEYNAVLDSGDGGEDGGLGHV